MRTIRTIVLSLLVIVVAFIAFTYLSGSTWTPFPRGERPVAVGTAGSVETAKERGAEMGEKVAVAAAKVKEEAGEAALTSKIKAKMVLDDNIKARAIDVTTTARRSRWRIVRSVDTWRAAPCDWPAKPPASARVVTYA
jgi:hypothetical protein